VILPDVNVLVYAFRREADHHTDYAGWLTEVVGGSDELAVVDDSLVSVVRIVTSRRIFVDPAPTDDALAFVDRVRAARRSRSIRSTAATWRRFGELVRADPGVRATLVPDAWLAAMALTHGCRLATADRGFARFPGLDQFDPVAR
jgi:uncharacterized protein